MLTVVSHPALSHTTQISLPPNPFLTSWLLNIDLPHSTLPYSADLDRLPSPASLWLFEASGSRISPCARTPVNKDSDEGDDKIT